MLRKIILMLLVIVGLITFGMANFCDTNAAVLNEKFEKERVDTFIEYKDDNKLKIREKTKIVKKVDTKSKIKTHIDDTLMSYDEKKDSNLHAKSKVDISFKNELNDDNNEPTNINDLLSFYDTTSINKEIQPVTNKIKNEHAMELLNKDFSNLHLGLKHFATLSNIVPKNNLTIVNEDEYEPELIFTFVDKNMSTYTFCWDGPMIKMDQYMYLYGHKPHIYLLTQKNFYK